MAAFSTMMRSSVDSRSSPPRSARLGFQGDLSRLSPSVQVLHGYEPHLAGWAWPLALRSQPPFRRVFGRYGRLSDAI